MKIKNFLPVVLLLGSIGCSDLVNNPIQEGNINSSATSISNGISISSLTVPTTGDNGPATFMSGIVPFGYKVVDLWAGQTKDAGSVTIYNDAANLYVTVYSIDGYSTGVEQLKMWVGADLLSLPVNGQGVPTLGQFPYKITTTGGTTYTFTIPLNSLPLVNGVGDLVYVVVHADVLVVNGTGSTSTETAFGGDVAGSGPRWWYYTSYTIAAGPSNPVFDHSETAFAKGQYVFTTDKKSNPENLPSLNLTKNRWGWAVNIKNDGTYTYNMWAGAGLNNTSKAKKAGTVTIVKSGSSITVTYSIATGMAMQEAHLYVEDIKPSTTAPGQYGNTYYFDPLATSYSASFTVSDYDGDGIWIIAHAVVNY